MKRGKGITKEELQKKRKELKPGIKVKIQYSSKAKVREKYKKTVIGILQPMSEKSPFFRVDTGKYVITYLLTDLINEEIVMKEVN